MVFSSSLGKILIKIGLVTSLFEINFFIGRRNNREKIFQTVYVEITKESSNTICTVAYIE